MKTSSGGDPPSQVDKPTAWACTAANVFTVPGLGTIAAGRKLGYLQAVMGLGGFVLSLIGFIGLLREWAAAGDLPEHVTPSLWVGLLGIALWGSGWLWALASSMRLHREAREAGKKT